jgi:hypothetical protein
MKIVANVTGSKNVDLTVVVDVRLIFSHEAGDKFFDINDYIEYIEAYYPEKQCEYKPLDKESFVKNLLTWLNGEINANSAFIEVKEHIEDILKTERKFAEINNLAKPKDRPKGYHDVEEFYQDDPVESKEINDRFWEKINKWDKWFTELEETRIYKFSSCDNEGINPKN